MKYNIVFISRVNIDVLVGMNIVGVNYRSEKKTFSIRKTVTS